MNQPQLNPDALRRAADELDADMSHCCCGMNGVMQCDYCMGAVESIVTAYLAAALPEVTGEQVNLAGWTCNGIHEPGDYSTCEECRDACDDLARFYNHMMRNPRPFKHWTGHPEVKP